MRKKFKIGRLLSLLIVLSITGYLVYIKSFFVLITFWFLLIYILFSYAVVKNWKKKELFDKRISIMLLIILAFLIVYGLQLFRIQFILKSKYVGLMNKQLISVNKEVGQRGCLLYTSPSPRDTERSRMPSSA